MNLSIPSSCLKIILCILVHLLRPKIVIFISKLIKIILRPLRYSIIFYDIGYASVQLP